MTGERCRHCGGRIEYVETVDVLAGEAVSAAWWVHVESRGAFYDHEAAPAFGGGS